MKNLLLVSPNQNRLDYIGNLLRENGFKVVRAGSESEVIFCLSRITSIDAAVLDVTSASESWPAFIEFVSIYTGGKPMLCLVGQSDLKTAVSVLKKGAYDYLLEPADDEEVVEACQHVVGGNFAVKIARARSNNWSREREMFLYLPKSKVMRQRFQQLGILARTEANLVLQGPKGVLKENFARVAHFLSPRRFAPFITVQCRRKNFQTLFADIFGVENDSQVAAAQKPGAIQRAQGGTIFLDEPDDLPVNIQYKLVDFVEEMEKSLTVGRNEEIVDVRFICGAESAVDQSPDARPLQTVFWEKMATGIVHLPDLRERKDDIETMIMEWIDLKSFYNNKRIDGLSNEALDMLTNYSWPGNDEELEQIIEKTLLATDHAIIQLSDLPEFDDRYYFDRKEFHLKLNSFLLDHVEERLISRVLAHSGGNISRSATTLGISRGTLYNKIRRYGLDEMLEKQ
jgi:two-component system response regulator AtoC